MSDYLRALFPHEDAGDLLDAIARTVELEDLQDTVDSALTAVRGMVGDYGRVEQAVDIWTEQVVARITASIYLVQNESPDLEAYWSGPASTAYADYSGQTVGRLKDVHGKAVDVVNELKAVQDTITSQYVSAVTEVLSLIEAVLPFVGRGGSVLSPAIDGALQAIGSFLAAVEEHIEQAIKSFNENKKFLEGVRVVVATLRVPAPVDSAGSAMDRPENWVLDGSDG